MGDPGIDPEIDLEDGELASESEEEDVADNSASPLDNNNQKQKHGGNERSTKTGSADVSKRRSESTSETGGRARPPGQHSKKSGKSKNPPERKDEKHKFKGDDHARPKGKRKAVDEEPEPRNFEDELLEYENSTRKLRRGSVDSHHSSHYGENEHLSPNARNRRGPPPPRAKKPRREEVFRPKEKRVPCKFFLEGRCKYGDDCPFSHNVQQQKKLEVCKFYVGGHCQKGPNCVYMHHDFPCKFFHTGQKCYSEGHCKFSHEVLSPDCRLALEKFLEKENNQALARHYKEHQMLNGDDGSGSSGGPPRNALLPTPDENPGDKWDDRRRPMFFRDTLPDDNQNGREAEPDFNYDSREKFGYDQNFQQEPNLEQNDQEEQFEDMVGPEGGDENSPDITRRLPKPQRDLFMRLQQRAQHQNIPSTEPEAEPPSNDSLDEDSSRLRIAEPDSNGMSPPKQLFTPNAAAASWNESDEEDDVGDQFLASSLKRLQEQPQPRKSKWNEPHAHLAQPDEELNEEVFSSPLELAEQRMNRGKILLATPNIPLYYPPPQFGYNGYDEVQPPYYPLTGPPMQAIPPPNYGMPPPHLPNPYEMPPQHVDPRWQYEQQHIEEYPPSEHYPPVYPPVHMPVIDPRLQRGPADLPAPFPVNENLAHQAAIGGMAIPPSLESVMKKLATKQGLAQSPPPVASPVPEIECSLEKNLSPPLYHLDAIVAAKPDVRAIYKRMTNYRSSEEMAKDPRLNKFIQEDLAKSEPSSSAAGADASGDGKAASQEFDAFTAMIQAALGKAKKKEEEETKKISPPGNKRLKRAPAIPTDDYTAAPQKI